MDVEGSEELEDSFNFSSALREVRQRIAVALPQATLQNSEFCLPGRLLPLGSLLRLNSSFCHLWSEMSLILYSEVTAYDLICQIL